MTTATQKVPSGYKQTEIGVIPADWDVKRLGDIADVVTGNTPPTHDRSNYGEDYLFVSPADLGRGKYILHTEKKLSQKGFNISRKYPKNSILFTCIGSTIGKAGIAPVELTSNQQINAIIPNDNFSSDFLFYSLNLIAPRIQSLAGEQAVPLVNKTEFENTPIALPSNKTEQSLIATTLSEADSLIAKLEKLIEKKRNVKQGAIQELLTGKQRLPGFSGKWEMRKLGDIAEMSSGGTPPSSVPEYYGGNIPWVSITDMTSVTKYLFDTERKLTDKGFVNSATKMFPDGTVLYAMYASIGECCIARMSVCTSQAILGIKPNKTLDNHYLYFYLTSKKEEVKKMGQQGTQSNLNAGMVKSFEILLPKLEEQTAIATVLSDVDTEIEKLESQLAKYRNLKQGMMQTLLTGKIRLLTK